MFSKAIFFDIKVSLNLSKPEYQAHITHISSVRAAVFGIYYNQSKSKTNTLLIVVFFAEHSLCGSPPKAFCWVVKIPNLRILVIKKRKQYIFILLGCKNTKTANAGY